MIASKYKLEQWTPKRSTLKMSHRNCAKKMAQRNGWRSCIVYIVSRMPIKLYDRFNHPNKCNDENIYWKSGAFIAFWFYSAIGTNSYCIFIDMHAENTYCIGHFENSHYWYTLHIKWWFTTLMTLLCFCYVFICSFWCQDSQASNGLFRKRRSTFIGPQEEKLVKIGTEAGLVSTENCDPNLTIIIIRCSM